MVDGVAKAYAMTGWRLGWLVVPDALVAAVEKLAQNLYICASTVAQHAALASFEAESIAEYERRRDQRNKPGLFPACGCPRVRRGKHRPGRLFGEPRFAQAFEDAIGREGWFAEAHSGCVEDRVGDGRRARPFAG